jgi:hypothetical protein
VCVCVRDREREKRIIEGTGVSCLLFVVESAVAIVANTLEDVAWVRIRGRGVQVSAIQTGRKKASHMRCLREYVVDIAVCECWL